tara:strand:- start:91 stop:225 length:135 start_codon:yes stop_codon:yes gene_type:complete
LKNWDLFFDADINIDISIEIIEMGKADGKKKIPALKKNNPLSLF